MVRLGVPVLGVVVCLVLAGPGQSSRAESPEPVRVYTNADLEKFGPPAPRVPPLVETEVGWRFVTEFIEREQARIDAERENDLKRREADRLDRMAEARDRSWGGGYLPGWWPGLCPESSVASPPVREMWPAGRVPYLGGASWQRNFLYRRETIHGRPPLSAPSVSREGRTGSGWRR